LKRDGIYLSDLARALGDNTVLTTDLSVSVAATNVPTGTPVKA
jgi:hypothetical protein